MRGGGIGRINEIGAYYARNASIIGDGVGGGEGGGVIET